MQETFVGLLHDKAHWEFEIFLMFVFDVCLAGAWRLYRRMGPKSTPSRPPPETPEGICDGCGGTVKHLIESGLKWCLGCGQIRVHEDWSMNDVAVKNSHTYHYEVEKHD